MDFRGDDWTAFLIERILCEIILVICFCGIEFTKKCNLSLTHIYLCQYQWWVSCIRAVFLYLFKEIDRGSQLLFCLIVYYWAILGSWVDALTMVGCWVMGLHENVHQFCFIDKIYTWMRWFWNHRESWWLQHDQFFLS